jgi:hypothetical protein
MDYQADSKTPKPSSDAILVLEEDHQQKKEKKKGRFSPKKSFWICCSNVEVAAGALGEEKKKNEKEKEKVHFKLKRYAFLCCSNVEFETEEEKERVLQYLENNNTKKSRINICCTNLVVGTKSSRSGA